MEHVYTESVSLIESHDAGHFDTNRPSNLTEMVPVFASMVWCHLPALVTLEITWCQVYVA